MMFVYKDMSVKIPNWPFYGETIVGIYCDTILEADKIFIDANPKYVTKGKINSTIAVSILK